MSKEANERVQLLNENRLESAGDVLLKKREGGVKALYQDCPVKETDFLIKLNVRHAELSACFMQVERCRRGELIFHEGDASDRIFAVRRGLVKTYGASKGGRKQILNIVAPGHFLGLECIYNNNYPLSARAMTDTDLCSVKKDDMAALLQRDSDVAVEIVKVLASELEYARDQIKILGYKGARRRVASFLLLLPCLLNAEAQDGVVLRIPLTRQEIAELLGLTIETVSRVLGRMRSDKIIKINCTKVELIDVEQLRRLSK